MKFTISYFLKLQVVKGRCRTVDLGSYKLEPSSGYNCHVPPVVKSRKLSRYVMHRFSQIYLFESSASGKFSKTPANVLPFAVYTVKFFPLASAKFNLKMINVWSGSLKSGPQVYYDIGLYSAGGVLLKPLSL
uniref:DUF5727 domain-containing protein n=1 Tax=Syphacia muris TaxID=451379 RepID=A0A0N5AP78_9BILA